MRKFAFAGLFGLAQLSALAGCGDFYVSIDYLYWGQANLFVDVEEGGGFVPDAGGGSERRVDPTYRSGVRGEAFWMPPCGCVGVLGRYYYVEPRQSQSFFDEGGGLGGVPSIATLSAEVPYHAGDILLSYPLPLCDCLQLNLLAGGHVLYWALNVQEPFSYPDGLPRSLAILERQLHSRLAGGGAAIGACATWDIWCGWQAFAEVQYGVIAGSYMQAGWSQSTFGGQIPFPTPPTRREFLPRSAQIWTREFDFRLGARYNWNENCFGVAIEAGWESRSYLDLNVGTLFYQSLTEIECFGRDMGGPFIGISGCF